MYKYEKVEHDNELPTKLHDFYIEDNIGEPIEKHWHRSIEILIPLYGSFILWINGNKVKITAGNIYIINFKIFMQFRLSRVSVYIRATPYK